MILSLFIKCIRTYFSLILTKKKKQSCLLIPYFESYGGTKTYFMSLIKFLSKNNYDITVMLSSNQLDNEIKKLKEAYPFKIEILEIDIWRTRFQKPLSSRTNKNYLIYQLKELLYFWNFLRNTRSSMIICSIGNPEELLFLFLSPVKMLYIIHTATMDRLDKVKRLLLNFRLAKNRQIITVSNFAKKYILQNWTGGRNTNYIQVVHNYYQPTTNNIQNKEIETPTILTIGAMVFYKNPIFWIEVCMEVLAKYSRPVKFIWAGDGPLLEECRTIVKYHPQIQFIGFQKNVEQLYAQCSVYFQPSIHESHGIAVLGAMYFEKPCVVANRGGLSESVVSNETGYIVDINHSENSAVALVSILKDYAINTEMGKKGRKRFDELFTLEIWENKMNLILNN